MRLNCIPTDKCKYKQFRQKLTLGITSVLVPTLKSAIGENLLKLQREANIININVSGGVFDSTKLKKEEA